MQGTERENTNTKTWIAFKKYFEGEYHDLREQQEMNTMQVGYHSANAAVAHQAPEQSRLTEALDNLALATSNDRDIVEQFTKKNPELTATNQQVCSPGLTGEQRQKRGEMLPVGQSI